MKPLEFAASSLLVILMVFSNGTITQTFSASSSGRNAVNDNYASQIANVAALPRNVTIQTVGETRIVDINITNVENLYGYEMKIWYRDTIVNATSVMRPVGHFLEPLDPARYLVLAWQIKNDFNSTHGRIWIAYVLVNPELGRNGSGILVRLTFTGLTAGNTPIVLDCYPGKEGPIKLANSIDGRPIPHTVTDGSGRFRDVAVIDVTTSSNLVMVRDVVVINVTVQNKGNHVNETFKVDVFLSVYANTTHLTQELVSSLPPGATKTLTVIGTLQVFYLDLIR